MDNNRRSIQGGEPAMDAIEWRTQLQPDSRQRIVNKIMDTLKKHQPFSGQDGLDDLKKIAERFEEKIYNAATSQSDYLRKISLKMLTMETKSQNTVPNSMPTTSNRPPGREEGRLVNLTTTEKKKKDYTKGKGKKGKGERKGKGKGKGKGGIPAKADIKKGNVKKKSLRVARQERDCRTPRNRH